MYRIDTDDAVSKLPPPDAPGRKPNSYFTNGDPIIGKPGTIVQADWANAVQEELCNAIELAGLKLDKTDRTQLSKVIGTKQVAFLATQVGTPQIFSPETATTVAFNHAIFDTNKNYDITSYRFTPKIAGIYLVYARCILEPETNIGDIPYTTVMEVIKSGLKISHERVQSVLDHYTIPTITALTEMDGNNDYIQINCKSSHTKNIQMRLVEPVYVFATKVN